MIQIPYHYTPREYQAKFMREVRDRRFAVLCWARRAGKDMTCFAYAITRMVEEPMNVALIFPTKEQGFKAFWQNIENDGFKTIEHIPKMLIASQSNTKDSMHITLHNGSTFMLLGASDPESLRGANAKLYILSEFVDIDSEVLNVIRPITAVNKGQIIIQSTPKLDGISGGVFKRLFDGAQTNPKQYASYITADNYLTAEELEEVRQEYITQNGTDWKYKQEMLLDWGAASATSYYGDLISLMEKDGRIGNHPYDPAYPVFTSWDLGGGADSTAIVFWQYYNHTFHLIDAHETHVIGDAALVRFVNNKKYNYGWHFIPWDGAKRDSDAVARIQKLRDLGLANASLLRRTSVEEGIKGVVELMIEESTTFNKPMVGWAIDKMKKYQRKFNELTGDYEGPDHKTESHLNDAMRYAFEAIKQKFDKTTGECFMMAAENQVDYRPKQDDEYEVRTHIYNGQEYQGDWVRDPVYDAWGI